jgi:hypothetical protein
MKKREEEFGICGVNESRIKRDPKGPKFSPYEIPKNLTQLLMGSGYW